LDFLRHAQENQIIVLCYPAHTTHIYQGLDVIIFAVLKHYLTEEHDWWLRDFGKTITKSNFLEFYSTAHVKALTTANILLAFRKTGIHPFNPDVVTSDMLAPAKESSNEGHLPLPPLTPICTVAKLLQKLLINDEKLDNISKEGTEVGIEMGTPLSFHSIPTHITATGPVSDSILPTSSHQSALDKAMKALSKSDLAYLIGSSA
jgi:hypothetical protein